MGSTSRDGWPRSWRTRLRATTTASGPSVAGSPPDCGLASNRGKLLLAMSSRMRWPGRNTFAVGPTAIRSSTRRSGSKGRGSASKSR